MSEPVKYLGEPPTVHWDACQLGGEVSASTTVKNSSTMRKKMSLNTPASRRAGRSQPQPVCLG